MDALEAPRYNGPDAEQRSAFRGPVARTAGAVFLPGDHHERHAIVLIFHRGVVDGHWSAFRQVLGDAAFTARDHEVFDAHVGERAASHHAVVAAPRAVTVEIQHIHAVVHEVFSRWGSFLDGTGGGNVVGRDAVAENAQRPGALDFANLAGLRGEILEERRLLDVRAVGVPLINIARAGWNLAPFGILFGEIPIEFLKNLRL